jgi:hypothetical protein
VSGTVTNLKIAGGSTALTATSGVYTLALRSPPFAGTVYKPDGVTPQPNAVVRVTKETPNGRNSWDSYSDKTGYFAVDLGSEYQDGQYTLQSWLSDSSDTSSGKSELRIETITAGVGVTNLALNLRLPNFVGVVSGVNGISKYNWVQLYKLDTFQNWIPQNEYRYTNVNGGFAYYLESGVYRVLVGSDMAGAGGGEGYSPACTVITESATVTTCNVSLPPPNTSGSLTIGGVVIQPSKIGRAHV